MGCDDGRNRAGASVTRKSWAFARRERAARHAGQKTPDSLVTASARGVPSVARPCPPRRFARTFAVTSSAWFLVALDRLVVTTALPTIRSDLGADLAGAEWTVNAYTLAFAALLLGGAALGDRFGRRRMFTVGMAVFTLGSAAAALAPTVGVLVAARAVQGAGAAIFAPAVADPAHRGHAAGTPRRGARRVGRDRRRGGRVRSAGRRRVDRAGRVAVGLLARRAGRAGPRGAGRAPARREPGAGAWVLPLHLFRSRAFALANAVALLHHAALFGALFLVTHLLQAGLGAGPLDAGLRLLPMAAMPMLLAPVGGAAADRWGTRLPMVVGVALVAAGAAGLAAVAAPGVAYAALAAPLVLMGAGSGLFFAPFAAAVLGAVAPHEQGRGLRRRDDGARGGRRAGRRAAHRGLRRPRRPRLGRAGRRRRRRGAVGRRRARRGGRAGRARPARPIPPLIDRRQPP